MQSKFAPISFFDYFAARLKVRLLGSAQIALGSVKFLLKKNHYQLLGLMRHGPEPVLSAIMQLADRDTLFIDVGANVGIFSIIVAAMSEAQVLAIEAVPSTYADLIENVILNCDLPITAFNICLSNKCGFAEMTNERAWGSNWVVETSNSGARPGATTQKLPSLTLDVLEDLFLKGSPNRYLVKIDVERHEVAVLLGGSVFLGRNIPIALCIEVEGEPNTTKIKEMLASFGFERFYPFAAETYKTDLIDAFFANSQWRASALNDPSLNRRAS